MNFDTYLSQAWSDHATQSEKVAKGLSAAIPLIENGEQLVQFAGLVTHVMGEHLGQWKVGIDFLKGLQSHASFKLGSEADMAIQRSVASLKLASGETFDLKTFDLSGQIRVLSIASTSLTTHDTKRAIAFLQAALELAKAGLEKKDPANRALAIAGNNTAGALEEKPSRTSDETTLMVLAAQTGRKYWEVAGTPKNVALAEYRLGMTYLQTKDLPKAIAHVNTCLSFFQADPGDHANLFLAYEGVAQVQRALQNEIEFERALAGAQANYEKMNDDDKSWFAEKLKNISKV